MNILEFKDKLKIVTPLSIRRKILQVRFAAQKPTASLRILPDVLVIGAMRSGTSSLFKYLGGHPAVIPSLRKETAYFSRWYNDKTEAWYRSHFPTKYSVQLLEILKNSRVLSFEATPDYLFHPYCAERAAHLLPNAKIIVLLRNPVERAFSHYQHMVRLGFETLSFEEALRQEPNRLNSEKKRILENPAYYSRVFLRFSYFARGLYAEQLQTWFKYYEKKQILILQSEEFYLSPDKTLQKILDFLELPIWLPTKYQNYSYLGSGTSKSLASSKLDEQLKQNLINQYLPYNQELYQHLGQNFNWDE